MNTAGNDTRTNASIARPRIRTATRSLCHAAACAAAAWQVSCSVQIFMEPVVGVFRSRKDATSAAMALRLRGLPRSASSSCFPATRRASRSWSRPTKPSRAASRRPSAASPGGAIGATAGLGLAAAVASVTLPGIGAVTAIGLAAAALLGAGGAAAGVAVGDKLEDKTYRGLPQGRALSLRGRAGARPRRPLRDARIGRRGRSRSSGPGREWRRDPRRRARVVLGRHPRRGEAALRIGRTGQRASTPSRAPIAAAMSRVSPARHPTKARSGTTPKRTLTGADSSAAARACGPRPSPPAADAADLARGRTGLRI